MWFLNADCNFCPSSSLININYSHIGCGCGLVESLEVSRSWRSWTIDIRICTVQLWKSHWRILRNIIIYFISFEWSRLFSSWNVKIWPPKHCTSVDWKFTQVVIVFLLSDISLQACSTTKSVVQLRQYYMKQIGAFRLTSMEDAFIFIWKQVLAKD